MAALCTLYSLVAQNGSGADGVRAALEECTIGDDRIKYCCSQYEKYSGNVHRALDTSAVSFPHVVNVDWRIDYHVHSSSSGRANVPMYYVSLETRSASGEKDVVEFRCTLQQLQDLAAKVQDAHKQVSRVHDAL